MISHEQEQRTLEPAVLAVRLRGVSHVFKKKRALDDITLDFMDEPVVSLATSNQFMSVQLDFDEEDAAMVSQLSSGQAFTALCDEVSEVAGTPMLDDCVAQAE